MTASGGRERIATPAPRSQMTGSGRGFDFAGHPGAVDDGCFAPSCLRFVESAEPGLVPAERLASSHDMAELLLRLRPDLSAAAPMWHWQKRVIGLLALSSVLGLLIWPAGLAVVVALALAVPFAAVFLLRLLAIAALVLRPLSTHSKLEAPPRRPDASLPTYAVLVPLYDEAVVVPGLVTALGRLDYPRDRLAIRFILEAHDRDTLEALTAIRLPDHMRVVVASPGDPRTKPRALDIALAETDGDYVVVYDAEDLPEPDQLRRAVAAFIAAPASVVCLQARLNTFNPAESWLARQFTIEYSALFDVLLPTIERYGLPVPLGGTSNHFRRSALESAFAWDPHNVTEDADLGIRLARFGMKVGVLDSTTWEEAPPTYGIWQGQRTRWLKGWMQTYLVHMRAPRRLLAELGWWPFIGFQILMGSMIASALVHPWFYVLLAVDVGSGSALAWPTGGLAEGFWWLAVANLVLGYATAVLVGGVAVWRRKRSWLLPAVLLVPAYWLLISWSAYRAVYELAVAPFHWEKTRHRAHSVVVER